MKLILNQQKKTETHVFENLTQAWEWGFKNEKRKGVVYFEGGTFENIKEFKFFALRQKMAEGKKIADEASKKLKEKLREKFKGKENELKEKKIN